MTAIIPLLFALILLGILVYAAVLIVQLIPLPENLRMLVYLVIAVIALALLAKTFGLM